MNAMDNVPDFSLYIRRANFTQEEKAVLLALVEKHRHWIIDSNTEGSSKVWRRKTEIWKEICREFNLHIESDGHRDPKQLRKCWENMKTRYRKASRVSAQAPGISDIQDEILNDHALSNDDAIVREKLHALMSCMDNRNNSLFPLDRSVTSSSIPGLPESSLSSVVLGDESMILETEHHTQPQPASVMEDKTSASPQVKPNIFAIEILDDDPLDVKPNGEMAKHVSTAKSSDATENISVVEATSQPQPLTVTMSSVAPPSGVENINADSLSTSTNVPKISKIHTVINPKKRKSPFISSLKGIQRPFVRNVKLNKPHNLQTDRPRIPAPLNPNALNHTRPSMVNTESILRVRFLRNRIREQETRIRMMQQKMRHERERHEALMTFLHLRKSHYENQSDTFQDSFNDDSDLSEEWIWRTL